VSCRPSTTGQALSDNKDFNGGAWTRIKSRPPRGGRQRVPATGSFWTVVSPEKKLMALARFLLKVRKEAVVHGVSDRGRRYSGGFAMVVKPALCACRRSKRKKDGQFRRKAALQCPCAAGKETVRIPAVSFEDIDKAKFIES